MHADAGLATQDNPLLLAARKAKAAKRVPSHLEAGPVLLSWFVGVATLALQTIFINMDQVAVDANLFIHHCEEMLSRCGLGDTLMAPLLAHESIQPAALYVAMYITIIGSSVYLIPASFPAEAGAGGAPMKVPRRSKYMPQHKMTPIDYSYVALNTLCMPFFFYHFFCLMRAWGLDVTDPPLYGGVYAPTALEMITRTLPQALGACGVYFAVYELLYYAWHRAMHEVPALFKWVHRHHHQQTYPDRAALDTFNTGCLESQLGLYAQIGVLWACEKLFGLGVVPGALLFFSAAGWMSVLEHDEHERSLPFGLFEAREHHMHHAFVKCNYSPYSTHFDKLFGTYKPFEVKASVLAAATSTASAEVEVVGASSEA